MMKNYDLHLHHGRRSRTRRVGGWASWLVIVMALSDFCAVLGLRRSDVVALVDEDELSSTPSQTTELLTASQWWFSVVVTTFDVYSNSTHQPGVNISTIPSPRDTFNVHVHFIQRTTTLPTVTKSRPQPLSVDERN